MRWRDFFRVNSTPLLYIAVDEGQGPPVILLHGIASSSVTFTHVAPLLRKNHRVIAMDLLGFGYSPNPPEAHFTLEEHVAAVASTIKSLRLKGPVTLVGHSLGALIANRYAAENKSRVKHLVMVSPPVYLPGHAVAHPLERLQMDAYRYLYDYMQANPSFMTAGAKALSQFSPIKNLLEVTEENWRAFKLSLENCIESQTTVEDVSQVTAPIDLIYGTRDFFLSSAGLRVLERMRGVTTTRVEGLDHIVRPRMAEEISRIVNDPSRATGLIKTIKG